MTSSLSRHAGFLAVLGAGVVLATPSSLSGAACTDFPAATGFATSVRVNDWGAEYVHLQWNYDDSWYDIDSTGYWWIEARDDTVSGPWVGLKTAAMLLHESFWNIAPADQTGPTSSALRGHTYTMRIAMGSQGFEGEVPTCLSPWSNESVVEIPAPPTPPDAPTGLSAYVKSRGKRVVLHWVDNSDDETAFRVERKDPHGTWTEAGSVGAGGVTWTDRNLGLAGNYAYRVLAEKAGGATTDTTAEVIVLAGGPAWARTCSPGFFSRPVSWTWERVANATRTLEISVDAKRRVTGQFQNDGVTVATIRGRLTDRIGSAVKGRVVQAPLPSVPFRFAVMSHPDDPWAWTHAALTLPSEDPDDLDGKDTSEWVVDNSIAVKGACFDLSAPVRDYAPGDKVTVDLELRATGPRGIEAARIAGAIEAEGCRILKIVPPKAGTVVPLGDRNATFAAPALGPPSPTARFRIFVQIDADPPDDAAVVRATGVGDVRRDECPDRVSFDSSADDELILPVR